MKLSLELKQILDNSMIRVYIADRERRIVYWNESAERISGRSREEMVGKYCFESGLDHIDLEGHQLEFVMEEFCEVGSQHIDDQMVRQLSNVAQHDQLTGIANRRFLDDALAYRIILRKEMNKQFGVLFMDVDNFSKFNNTYGHEAGDLVLKKLTHTLTSINRKNDIFGRWGGEEFLGIYPIQDPSNIRAIAEKCLNAIRSMDVEFEGLHLSVTASIGITCIRENDTPESVTQRAGALMYKSKQNGKDRYTSDEPAA